MARRHDPPARFVTAERPAGLAAMAAAPDVAAAPAATAELIHDVRPLVVRPAARSRVVWMVVTAYCPCPKCCGVGAKGVTASGRSIAANAGHFVAAPAAFPFQSRVSVPGYDGGRPVPVLDRGGAIKADHLDVFFRTHDQAKKWGRQFLPVTVVDEPVVR